MLKDEMLDAMDQGQWYATHVLQHADVKSLTDELVEVLQGMQGDTKGLYMKIGRSLER